MYSHALRKHCYTSIFLSFLKTVFEVQRMESSVLTPCSEVSELSQGNRKYINHVNTADRKQYNNTKRPSS